MLRAIKVGVVYYNRRFESRRREMKKKNTKKRKEIQLMPGIDLGESFFRENQISSA